MKTITLTFNDDGTVEKEVQGFKGGTCKDATKFIEQAVGTVVEEKLSPEYYIPTPAGIDQQQKIYR